MPNEQNTNTLRTDVLIYKNAKAAIALTNQYLEEIETIFIFYYPKVEKEINKTFKTIGADFVQSVKFNNKYDLTLIKLKNQWLEKVRNNCKRTTFSNFIFFLNYHFLDIELSVKEWAIERNTRIIEDINLDQVKFRKLPLTTLLDSEQTEAIETNDKNLQKLIKVLLFSYNSCKDLVYEEIQTISDDILNTIQINQEYSLTLVNLKNTWIEQEIENQKQLIKENNVPPFHSFQESWRNDFLSLEITLIESNQESLLTDAQSEIPEPTNTNISPTGYKTSIIERRLNLNSERFSSYPPVAKPTSEEEHTTLLFLTEEGKDLFTPAPKISDTTDKNNNEIKVVASSCSSSFG